MIADVDEECIGCQSHIPEYRMCNNIKNGVNKRGTGVRKYTWLARRLGPVTAVLFGECGKSGRWYETKEEES